MLSSLVPCRWSVTPGKSYLC